MASGGNGLYTLATIIKRLEAVASRIEDVADIQEQRSYPAIAGNGSGSSTTSAVPVPPPPPPPPPPAPAAVAEDPKSVTAFDDLVIDSKLKPFLELTRGFAPESVKEQITVAEEMFGQLRRVLVVAGACKKPDQKSFSELLTPLQASIEKIVRLKEANRKERDWFNHFSAIAEGAPAVGWITVEPKPGPYVQAIRESAQFYTNRVIAEFKEKEPKHVEWARSYMAILEELRKYIMEYHTTGLVWNPKGVAVSEYSSQSSTAAPPPPPPPGPVPPAPPAGAASPSPSGAAALFADLSRGDEVTKGLRKVNKSEMTHKNPALRAGSTVPATASSPPPAKRPLKPTKPQALAGKKPAKMVLEGSKWLIEYQENESGLTIENGEINQIVNLFGCKNTTVVIKGKVNAVTIVNCTKTSVLVESVISTVSVTASPSFALQITGSAPTIQIDNTDSGQIYLSKDCLGVEVTTAKCSSINISLPVEGEEEGVFEEKAVPEMLRTTIQNGVLVTSVVEHVG